jgi:hypothetical protein
MPPKSRWSLEELRKETGVGRVLMRRFVRDGFLPHPGFGPGAGYALDERRRLLSLVALRRQGFFGAALRSKLETEGEAEAKRPALASDLLAAESTSASTWLRVVVAPGVELHVDLGRADGSKTAAMLKALGLKVK